MVKDMTKSHENATGSNRMRSSAFFQGPPLTPKSQTFGNTTAASEQKNPQIQSVTSVTHGEQPHTQWTMMT